MTKNIFYTSDLHIGHRKVAGIRGFWDEDHVSDVPQVLADGSIETMPEALPDTDEHDRVLADNWDAVVHPEDTVYVLGDISINGGEHALEWMDRRPGNKILVAGNHDPVNPMFRTAEKAFPRWMQTFDMIVPFMRKRLEGQNVLLSHFPYESWGDGPERGGAETSRHNQYRLPEMDLPLLHGHTHGPERAHGSMFHVGVDAWNMQLVRQEVIQEWLTDEYRTYKEKNA